MRWATVLLFAMVWAGMAGAQEPAGEQKALWDAQNAAGQDPEGALKAYEQLMKEAESPVIRLQASYGTLNLLARLGRAQEAVELYDELAAQPEGPGAEGLASSVLGGCDPARTQALIALLDKRSAAEPANRDEWVLLATAREHANRWDDAVTAWQHAIALGPTPAAEGKLAYALLRAKRYEEALSAAEDHPDPSTWLRTQVIGPALAALGRTDEARALADELAAELQEGDSAYGIVRLYQQAGAHEQAIALLQRLLEKTKPDAYNYQDLTRRLAAAYEAAGDAEKAYQQYKAAAVAGDSQAVTWLSQHAADKLLDPAQFEPLTTAILGKEPHTYRSRAYDICWQLRKAGKLDDLLSTAQVALAEQPDSAPLMCLVLQAETLKQDHAAAAQTASKLFGIEPEAVDRFTLASLYKYAGNYAAALEWIEQTDVSHWPIYCAPLVVECCKQLGQMDKLEGFAAHIHEAPGARQPWAYLEGELWLEAGQAERAIPLLEEARGLQGYAPERLLARAYSAAGRPQDAIAAYEATLKEPSAWASDILTLVALYTQTYAPAEYVPRLAEVLRKYPAPVGRPDTVRDLWREVVKAENQANRLADLAAALETECAANATDPPAWAGLGLTQLALQQYDPALLSLTKAIGLDQTGQLRQSLASAYGKAQKREPMETPAERWARVQKEYQTEFQPALEVGNVERAAKIACDLLDCHFGSFVWMRPNLALNLAYQARKAGQADEFAAALMERLEAEPGSLPAVHLLAAGYRDQRRDEDLVAFLHGQQAAADQDADLCAILGDGCGRLGRVAEAEVAYRHILELDPNNWDQALGLGWAYQQNQLLPEAEAWAERALAWVDEGENRSRVAAKAARLLAWCGAADKATAAAAKAVGLAPNSGPVLQEAAEVYRRLERWDDLTSLCQKALALEDRSLDRKRMEQLLQEAQAHQGGDDNR